VVLVLVCASGLAAQDVPAAPREFRGVWVATVANVDWPSKKGLTVKQQQTELLAILNKAVQGNFNAVILQVRPMADALYPSKLEPWSEYLTGKLGQAPEPLYDPLAMAVHEAHRRGLELHAWFNPFRARHPSATGPIPDEHVIKRRPDLARPYGRHYWLNPTSKEVQDHSIAVILDVVKRYDIDGVHIDDYFYPYKEKDADGKVIPFPDDDTWAEYRKGGGSLARDDWRRAAVNRFVERMYREVKTAKPWVKVGISPFGIWRPGNPAGIVGVDQYADLYADAKRWLNEGWCDYFAPQLYWPIKQEKQSFQKLLAWWAGENRKDRLLCPGLFTSKVNGTPKGWPKTEIVEQIELARKQPGVSGEIHFSMKAILHNTGGVDAALRKVYGERVLPPATPWAGLKPPRPPEVEWQEKGDRAVLRISPASDGIRRYVVRTFRDGQWYIRIAAAGEGAQPATVLLPPRPEVIVVTAVDRAGGESPPTRPVPRKR
jgi:uncharacterized lipoprotein YddW (UPF0748 family)